MSFIFFLVKTLVVLLLFRYVATQQELTFNPAGKLIATVTDPLFKRFQQSKIQTDRYIPFIVLGLIFISIVFATLIGGMNPILATFLSIRDFLLFFMLFFIISVMLGAFVNKPMMSGYVMYFFRLGSPWVKLTRTFIPISTGGIVYPTVLVVFIIYLVADFLMVFGFQILTNVDINMFKAIILSLKSGLLGLVELLFYASWLMVARALMSWVSPDVRNPVVQMIYTLTEPILSPFRKIIPPIGLLDMSAFVAIIALNVVATILQRLIMQLL